MYQIDEKLVNAVLQYLGNKPFGEVHQLIGALTQLQKLEDKKD
jgi:hypothetical protein